MRAFKRSAAAFLLSLFVPGLGQIFNGQMVLGVALFVFYALWVFSAGVFHLLYSFPSAIFYALVLWILMFSAAIHAVRVAIRQVRNDGVSRKGWRSYALSAVMVCIIAVMVSGNNFPERILGVHAYKIPADSMNPTIVSGDHLMVNMRYYKTNRPKRGDVVVYRIPVNNVLFVKRVVAIGGDTIAGDSKGTILNGQRISEPYILSEDTTPPVDSANFGPISIPANQFFVMGDNRNHSYDSRYLGPVDVNRLVGRPLYIYYSSASIGRIGHTIQ
jgi:signal peptidase I